MVDSALFPKGFRSLSVPTFRATTVPFSDYASYRDRGNLPRAGYSYGLAGTPTTRVLQGKITELHGALDTFLVPSGLSAITTTFLALCRSGDVVVIPDNVYPPVRRFARDTLARLGIETVYYDPREPETQLRSLDQARLVWCESPGSTTHEVVDFVELRNLADRLGAWLGADNSWASPYLCRPLSHGFDIVVEAVSKHLSGHSDLLMGSISVGSEDLARSIHESVRSLGLGVSPDDCFLALRGLETAKLRIRESGASATELACFLSTHPNVAELLYPAHASSPDNERFTTQFDGPGSVLTCVLAGPGGRDFEAMLLRLQHFTLGASWGGTHSVISPAVLDTERTVDRRYCGSDLVRLGVGVEDTDALIEDIERFLKIE